jgi:multidrug resistance efflux pump
MRTRRGTLVRPAIVAAHVGLLLGSLAVPTSLRAQTAAGSPPSKAMQLGVAASGVIQKIVVANGSHVDAGQLLLLIDCRPLEAEVKLRTANLAAAQAAYERTRNGARPDEVAIAEASVGVAQARAEEAQDAFSRLKALTEGVSITRAQTLEARRDARVTAAQLEDARKRLALLAAGSRAEDIAEQLARRDAGSAGLVESQAQLDQCSLRAPAAGVVQIVATLGQFISVSVPVTLIQLTPDDPAR